MLLNFHCPLQHFPSSGMLVWSIRGYGPWHKSFDFPFPLLAQCTLSCVHPFGCLHGIFLTAHGSFLKRVGN